VTREPFGAENEEKMRGVLREAFGQHFAISDRYQHGIPQSPGGKYFDFHSDAAS
jgi:hypothetical protein